MRVRRSSSVTGPPKAFKRTAYKVYAQLSDQDISEAISVGTGAMIAV